MKIEKKYGATMLVGEAILEDAAFDVRTYVSERLREQIYRALDVESVPEVVPNSWSLFSEPVRETHEIPGRGLRGFLERLGILRPKTYELRGEMFRASLRVLEESA